MMKIFIINKTYLNIIIMMDTYNKFRVIMYIQIKTITLNCPEIHI